MRFIFLLFISFLFVNAAVAQDKKAPTQEQLKELSRIQNEKYENQKKKEWDAYLVRVEADKLAKKQKKVADSIEKSKLTDNVKNDIDDFTKCSVQELPFFKVKNMIPLSYKLDNDENLLFKTASKKGIHPYIKIGIFAFMLFYITFGSIGLYLISTFDEEIIINDTIYEEEFEEDKLLSIAELKKLEETEQKKITYPNYLTLIQK